MLSKALLLGMIILSCDLAAADQMVSPDLVAIEDADTLLVDIAGNSYKIQLPGIDAPESSMNPKLQRDITRTGLAASTLLPLGVAANNCLQDLLVEFQPYRLLFDPQKKDRYGRTPGDLMNKHDKALSHRMVQQGCAIPIEPLKTQRPNLIEAAELARQAKQGLWQSHPDTMEAWRGSAR